MNRSLLTLLLSFTFSFVLLAQVKINQAIQLLEKDPTLKNAAISFCAVDINTNKIYATKNPNLSLIPASSLKVITTGAALAILGKDYRFKTYLEYSGTIKNGVLYGNLYIRGTGDPSLASPIFDKVEKKEQFFNHLFNAIKKAGIKSIQGAIIGDASYFDKDYVIESWQWGDIGNHYGAGVSGLNFHDNLYYINFKKNPSYGARPKIVSTRPALPNIKPWAIKNYVTSAGARTGDNAYVFTAPFGKEASITGTIPKGSSLFTVKAAVPDPALLAAYSFSTFLKNNGIQISKEACSLRACPNKTARKTLYTYLSPKLGVLVKHTNENSRNLYCEAFVKAIGKKIKQNGSTETGVAVIIDFWRARGIDMSGFFMKDGSGLSARSAINSKTMAQIMRKMYLDTNSFANFYNQLAVFGKTGTLKYFDKSNAAYNNVRAKSGSMNRIRSYTGYVTTKKGKKLAFCIIVNNYTCSGSIMRKKLVRFMVSMAEST